MSRFAYIAQRRDGEEVRGTMKAPSVSSARAALADRDLTVHIVEERPPLLKRQFGSRVPRADVMHVSRQLAAFIRAGVPLLEGVDVLAEESGNPALRRALRAIGEALRAGDTFSQALANQPKVFPPFMIAVVQSAELTGRLDNVLDQVARYVDRDLEARRKLKQALTYPALILVLSIGAIAVLTGFVLPRLKSFLTSFGGELPATTRVLLGAADFVSAWWWALLGGLVAAIVGTTTAVRTPRGRLARDKMLLRLPLIKQIVRYAIVERTCRMLGSMVRAGVPLPDAMAATSRGSGNAVFVRELANARESMLHGDGFARPIARTGLFPAPVVQMMRVGEDTGTLDDQLEAAASFYEAELDFSLKRLTTMFEPAMILTMGLMVAFVALAMVQAMYGVLTQAGKL